MRHHAEHACLLAVLAALVLGAPGAQASLRAVLVEEPGADAALDPLAPGAGLWLTRRIEAAGLRAEPVPRSPGSGPERMVELAAGRGAAYALMADLRLRDGEAEVRLRLYPSGRAQLLAAPAVRAPLAKLGEALDTAAGLLLDQLGIPAEQRGSSPPPLLDELACTSRALAWLERGELHRAWREVEGKLSPTAMQLRENIVDSARSSDAAASERARVLAAAGDEHGAWSLISTSLAGPAPDRKLLLAAAEVQIARGNARAALETLERVLASHPDDPEARLDLGLALAQASDAAAAKESLALAARLDSSDPRPLQALERLQEREPEARAQTLLKAGRLEAARLNPPRAERLLQRAAELDPDVAPATRRELARLHQRLGRNARALRAWQRLAAEEAPDAEIWLGIGRAQRALGDPEAQRSLERALALEPRNPGALTELGRLHTDYGRAELAVTVLQRAGRAAPRDEQARRELARALRATGRPADALAVLTDPEAPPAARAETLRLAAQLQREVGDLDAARGSLRRAATLDPWNPGLLNELADLGAEAGDAAEAARVRQLSAVLDGGAAEAVGPASQAQSSGGPNLDNLALAFSSQVPRARQRRVAQLGIREEPGWRRLVEQWFQPRIPDLPRLEGALEDALALRFSLARPAAPDSPLFRDNLDRLYAFDASVSLDAQAIADVNGVLDTDAVFLTRLRRPPASEIERKEGSFACGDPRDFELETRMLAGRHADVATILVDVECVPDGVAAHSDWNRRALAIYGCVVLLLLYPLLRGWGTLVVEIKLPPRTKGFLHIKIGRKPEPPREEKKRRNAGMGRLRRSLGSFSRYVKRMAGRETVFRWIPARRRAYYVTVRGPLHDAMGGDEIGHFLEEQRAQIQRGQIARLVYDLAPTECAVQVTVLWNGEPAPNARVALRDDPNSLRYARAGGAFYHLGKGSHTLVVGAHDRATERCIEIRSVEHAIPVEFDLGDETGLMVRGCADAVEPYLLGDFAAAAAALEVAGEEQGMHLMRGAHFQQNGELERAADEFEAAGCIEAAAELRASGADHQGSAVLFEQAGDYARAADAHRAAGDLEAAARCYQNAYDYDNALECWEAVGDFERVIEIHEKTGAYLTAAEVACTQGNLDRALQNLQQIERRDPSYAEACRLSADVLAQRGEFTLAAEKQAEAIEGAGGERAPVEMQERLAELLAQGSDKQRALEAYETVRRMDPRRRDVTQHIDALREDLSRNVAPTPQSDATRAESRYEILEELGRGGMGVVYKARDRHLGRIVALKRLPDNLRHNEAAARLFLREARAAASLNHRHIVTVYDAGEENGVYQITMELLEGLPLNAIQQKRGRISVPDTAQLGIQVCGGLHYAHERRIVHRDIKTANLFFTHDRVVKIMDFGLAKTIEEVRKSSTVIGGTPYYMAPEQAAGDAVDHRTDLYALGVTFFRLLTGTFPFSRGDLGYHHRHTPPPDPREHCPELPEDLAALILELLAKDPDGRPASAADVAARLQAFRRG